MTKPVALARGGARDWIAVVADADVAGHVRLPDGIRSAIAAVNALAAEHVALADHERRAYPGGWQAVARAGAAQRLAAALLERPTVPADAGAELAAAEAAYSAFTSRLLVVREAAEQAGRYLDALCSDEAISVVLGDALEAVLEAVRGLPTDTPTSAEAALGAEAGRIAAYRSLRAAVERHAALRAAQTALRGHYRVQRDTLDLFADTPTGPAFSGRMIPRDLAPAGPTEPIARLRWLAGEGQGWVPTAAEQDAAFSAWASDAAASFSRVRSIAPLVG